MVFYTEGVFKMNVNRLTAHIPYRIRVANKIIRSHIFTVVQGYRGQLVDYKNTSLFRVIQYYLRKVTLHLQKSEFIKG